MVKQLKKNNNLSKKIIIIQTKISLMIIITNNNYKISLNRNKLINKRINETLKYK
jgi:hypothetical protein